MPCLTLCLEEQYRTIIIQKKEWNRTKPSIPSIYKVRRKRQAPSFIILFCPAFHTVHSTFPSGCFHLPASCSSFLSLLYGYPLRIRQFFRSSTMRVVFQTGRCRIVKFPNLILMIIWQLTEYALPLHPHPNHRILNLSERYNQPRQFSLYYKGVCAAQENKKFSCKMPLNYLAVPNNLLLSHRRYRRNVTPKHSRIRARGDPAQSL